MTASIILVKKNLLPGSIPFIMIMESGPSRHRSKMDYYTVTYQFGTKRESRYVKRNILKG